jgi:DNA repair exonuclease SbcCD ATPase subunit
MMRIIQLIIHLHHGRWTIKQLADRFDASERTIYRDLGAIEDLDFPLEQDFSKRYFIANEKCPVCEKPIPPEADQLTEATKILIAHFKTQPQNWLLVKAIHGSETFHLKFEKVDPLI